MNHAENNVEKSALGGDHRRKDAACISLPTPLAVIVAGHAECFCAGGAVLEGTDVAVLSKETKVREVLSYAQALSDGGSGVFRALVPFLPRIARLSVTQENQNGTDVAAPPTMVVSLSVVDGRLCSDVAGESVSQQLELLERLATEQDYAEMRKFLRSFGGRPALDGGGARLQEMMLGAMTEQPEAVPSPSRSLRSTVSFENVVGSMTHPCVVDVKVGKRRYHPFTPREKRAKIELREGQTSTAFTLGIRVCGSKHWVWQEGCEGCHPQLVSLDNGKETGHAMRSADDLRQFFCRFFSPLPPAIEDTGAAQPDDETCPSAAVLSCALRRYAATRVRDLATRLKERRNDIETSTALVSCSVLIVYDAALWLQTCTDNCWMTDVVENCAVFVIDLARCGPRDHNYSEDLVDVIGSVSTLAEVIEPSVS